jgi:DNA-binding NarL/FixJ family response regulator
MMHTQRDSPATPPYQQHKNLLTSREWEVLSLLAEGHSYKMIAEALGISNSTVPCFIKRIYAKLQVHSAAGAIAKVFLGKKDFVP